MPNIYKFRAIPSVDILNKQIVRLHKGDFNKLQYYADSPLSFAKMLNGLGHQFLHVVDLDGAKAKQPINLDILEKICAETNLHIDYGGGVRTDQDIDNLFNIGVKQVTIGTVAIKNEDLARSWLDKYGPEAIILGADVKNGNIAISGWTESETQKWEDFISKWEKFGIKWIISTDISKDGDLQGPGLDLYKSMKFLFPNLSIIASGGVGSYADINNLCKINISGVVIGKALHDGVVSPEGIYEFNLLQLARKGEDQPLS